MRLVFLDVDGVLNYFNTAERCDRIIGVGEEQLQTFAEFVRQSSEEEDTKIVLSSSWRKGINKDGVIIDNGYSYLAKRLSSVGLSIFDQTPQIRYHLRGTEIATYLATHEDFGVTGYVILDDEFFADMMQYGLNKHLVATSFDNKPGGFLKTNIPDALSKIALPYSVNEVKDVLAYKI